MVVPPSVTSPLSSVDSIGPVIPKRHRNRQNGNLLEAWLNRTGGTLYPTREQKDTLAREMQMSYIQVNRWFANRRRKSASVHRPGEEEDTEQWNGYPQTDGKSSKSPPSCIDAASPKSMMDEQFNHQTPNNVPLSSTDDHLRTGNTDFWAEALQISAIARTGSTGVIQKADSNNNTASEQLRPNTNISDHTHLPQYYPQRYVLHPQRTDLLDCAIGLQQHHHAQQQMTPPALGLPPPPPSLLFPAQPPPQQQNTTAAGLLDYFHQQQQAQQEWAMAAALQRHYMNIATMQHQAAQQQTMMVMPSPPLIGKNRLALLDADNLTENESIAVSVLADLASFSR